MRKHLRLIALGFLFVPLTTYASLYKIEYSGYVSETHGTGLGYTVGDYVSGVLNIDFSKASGDTFPTDDSYAQYQSAGVGADFVSGYLPANFGDNNRDSVRINNGVTGPAGPIPGNDSFYVGDFATFNGADERAYALELSVYFQDYDWLVDDKIREFNLVGSDLWGASAVGSFSSRYLYTGTDGGLWLHNDQALFDFDAIRFSLVSVPEPGLISLMFLGGLALFARRRSLNLSNTSA